MSDISRRDFINGSVMVAGSSLVPSSASGQEAMAALAPSYYPPALSGLRGSHPGSNDHAHAMAWSGRTDWGPVESLDEAYDLVVVGGGISGLAAARIYQQQQGRDQKILILDNHDDFGGHAKRNEHTVNGRTLISYGGSQTLVEPRSANDIVANLLTDIGVDTERFESAYDRNFFKRHGLGAVTYFSEAVFGENKVVQHPYCNYPNYIEGIPMGVLSLEEAAREAPLSQTGREQLLRVLQAGLHVLDVPDEQLDDYVRTHSYLDYLRDTLGVDDPGVLRMARHSGLDWGSTGTELMTIAQAESCGALGFEPFDVYDEDNPYIHHFPDGNAGIARAIVKKLIPSVADGDSAEALVLAQFDYSQLDKPDNDVRIRLNSTAVSVRHAGTSQTADQVDVTFVNDNTAYEVRARHVVMACYNAIVPHVVKGLPKAQAEALHQQGKSPLQYTTVSLRNWRALKEQGIGMAMSPGNMHQAVLMDFPVSMGGYEFTSSPDEPCILQLISCPYGTYGAPATEQFREARYRMLTLQFADYEAEVRNHLEGMLDGGLFDFDRDVAGITVNRWAHGYSFAGPGDTTRIGRQPFGRVTIANSDSAASADAKVAIMTAHRAVSELP